MYRLRKPRFHSFSVEVTNVKVQTAIAVLSASLVSVAHGSVHDKVFKGSFDFPPDAPASIGDASRFLTQATFGASTQDVNYLMAQGIDEWLEEQIAAPATLSEPTVEAVVVARTAGGQGVGNTQRLNRFYWQAAYAPDQLRQRMAYALSQIFVVSDRSSAISGDVVPLAHYQDVLAEDAFSPYPTLLHDVTYNPSMGKYLNAFHNIKPLCSGSPPNETCTSPDENYAREVMQLFSVGLIMLNMDHTPVLDGMGNPIPTYDQSTITHTAKVFTGFTYSDAPLNPPNFYGGNLSYLGAYSPDGVLGDRIVPVRQFEHEARHHRRRQYAGHAEDGAGRRYDSSWTNMQRRCPRRARDHFHAPERGAVRFASIDPALRHQQSIAGLYRTYRHGVRHAW